MSTTKKDKSNLKTCPFTVTVRRNPPRRARATPSHGITPFPNEEILSEQVSLNPAATSEDEILKNQSTSENENLINPPPSETENLINPSENENLKVFLRIRPSQPPNQAPRVRAKTAWPKNQTKNVTNNSKKKSSSSSCISINDSQSVTLLVPSDLQDAKRVKSEIYGGFTHVFPSDSSQLEVYERMVKPMVDEFTKGKSGMLAALGPSGSGKTHTVFGTPRDPGMVPLVLRHIFKETEASRSYYIAIFEIYTERGKSEKLFDLLPDGSELSMQQSTIKGQKEVLISNAEQAETLIAQAVIKRQTAMTNTNSQSSRSQCIINVRDVPKKGKGVANSKSNNAVLTIIDLAGAEREKRTGNQGTRLVESNFINNTLMVFGLCLRSLLEHQKNPKKQLQKHFQNSMLTRYLRDYLEGKKRMTLLLTTKSAEDDYLDTSHLLRQASPYMQIKYNEVEPSINMVPKKRLHQASSIIDSAKQSPSLAHLKRMKLVGEHTGQAGKGVEECNTSKKVSKFDASSSVPEKGVEECNTSNKDTSTVSKFNASSSVPENGVEECNTLKKDTSTASEFDASSSVPLKSKCDSHVGSERSHIIMRNFARVLWNVLKQYNSKLKVAESEILSLEESIGYEKEKNQELETQLNAFRAACTCCKGGNEKTNTEDGSLVDLDYLHDLDQKETLEAKSSSEPRIDLSDEEHILGTTSTKLDSKKSRKVSVSSTKSGHRNALEADDESKDTFHAQPSSDPILNVSNEEPIVSSEPILDVSNEEPIVSSEPILDVSNEEPIVSSKPILDVSNEEPIVSSKPILDVSNEEPIVSSEPILDVSNEEPIVSSEPILDVSNEEPIVSSEPILDVSNEEPIVSSEPILDVSNEEPIVSSEPILNVSNEEPIVSSEPILDVSNEEPILDVSNEEPIVSSEPILDVSNEEPIVSSEPILDVSNEEPIVSSEPILDVSNEEPIVSSEPILDVSNEDPIVSSEPILNVSNEDPIVSSEPILNVANEEPIVSSEPINVSNEEPILNVSNEEPIVLSEPILNVSNEEPILNVSNEEPIVSSEPILSVSNEEPIVSSHTQLDSEKSDREVSVSWSMPECHDDLEVDAMCKISSEFNVESSSEPRLDQSDAEHMLGSTCSELDYEKSDRKLSVSLSKSGHHNSLEVDTMDKMPCEIFHSESSEPSNEEHMLGSTCTAFKPEKSDREVSGSLSNSGVHEAFEVNAVRTVPNEILNAESPSKPRIDQLGEEKHMLGSTCTKLDSEIPDREVSVSSPKPGHDNSLKVDVETFHPQTSSEPMTDPDRQLDSEKSNSLVLGVLASSSKPRDHKELVVEAKSKMPIESLDSSLSTRNHNLDPSLPKDVSSMKGINNSPSKPPRSKRTLMPSSSILSRNLSTFDLFDESEKLKENRGTRKLGARDDPKRSNGSISLLHMLHGRKGNIRH